MRSRIFRLLQRNIFLDFSKKKKKKTRPNRQKTRQATIYQFVGRGKRQLLVNPHMIFLFIYPKRQRFEVYRQ